ncbi:MAG: hypothetical protein FJ298_06445 [Planctomycetes bacterium]|nr:hypothetical protein [Planctomycetota bacterium]
MSSLSDPSPRDSPRGAHRRTADARGTDQLCGGNRVELLVGGEATYAAMLAAISAAERSIQLTTYILHSDATGERFAAALAERATAMDGRIDVRLMFDAVGSFGTVSEDYLLRLVEAGVKVHIYHPILPARRRLQERLQELHARYEIARGRKPRPPSPFTPDFWGFHRRNHQKILVVDDRVAFTGGINIGDEYLDREVDGRAVRGWHDLHVRVEGPAAVELGNAFRGAWNRSGGVPMPGTAKGRCEKSPVRLAVCANVEWDATKGRFRRMKRLWMRSAYLEKIWDAVASVRIANAYFLPDAELRLALCQAAERGVRVQVIVPKDPDVRIVYHASRYVYDELLVAGVEIHEFVGSMMHAKAAVIDDAWATVGSFNLDHRSFRHNLEAGVRVEDGDFAARLAAQFERDLASCERVELGQWRGRSWFSRLREALSHLFAWWL